MGMPRKILFCATVDYHFTKFHIPYMKWFKEQGWEVHVAASGQLELPYTDVKFSIPIHRSPFRYSNMLAFQKLKTIINQENYDIIHCHTPLGGVLARLAAVEARARGTKIIYTAHGFHFYKGASPFNWMLYYPIEKQLAKITDCLITINTEDYLLAKEKEFKASLIEHVHGVGVNTERFTPMDEQTKKATRETYRYKDDEFLLIYAAEFNHNKNQKFLMQAIEQLKKEIPKVRLLLAGEGPTLQQCQVEMFRLGIASSVDFLGQREDIDTLLPMCDVAVASSLREGLPVNVMEAMACGLPVVAVTNRGHRELVEHEVNGYLVERDDVSGFVEKILTLYQNKTLKQQLGKESRSRVSHFSLVKVQKELESVYAPFMLGEDYEEETKDQYHHTPI